MNQPLHSSSIPFSRLICLLVAWLLFVTFRWISYSIQSVDYLSDLSLNIVSNGWGPLERDRSNGEEAAGDGGPITLNGVTYAKGLGVHAPSDVRIGLGGNYTSFIADIGVDDEMGNGGTVVFQVWADGVKLYDSGLMKGNSSTKNVNVNVSGKSELKLVVTNGGDNIHGDHADWADARLIRSDYAPPGDPEPGDYISDLNFTVVSNGWGPVEKDRSNGEEAAGDGGPITLNGVMYNKGLGVHAVSDVRVNLAGNYSDFIADVGIDDEMGSGGTVVFQVWADGVKLYDSGLMTGSSPTKQVNVGVAGKKELKLVVANGGDNVHGDHADWADARLVVGNSLASAIGQWTAPMNWPTVPVHASLLPNGKVLFWNASYDYLADIHLWDPATNTFPPVPQAPSRSPLNNLFCSGHSFLPDGRLLVVGGHQIANGIGIPYTNIFDYRTSSWVQGPLQDMNAGRWYPTTCVLGNGEVVVVSGNIDNSQGVNKLPQVWKTTGGWRSLTGALLELPLYPTMHLAPNGNVFLSGPRTHTRYLDVSGTGKWTTVAYSLYGYRDTGGSVMYEPGKVLIMGGGAPTSTAEVIDLNNSNPRWRSVGMMAYARRQLNTTLLADGKVLVTGGSSGGGFNNEAYAVLTAEMWDPQTEQWTKMASQQTPRLYHSIACLLPDGRVLSAGGGMASNYKDYPSAEIYSPPYLFKGPRPTITSAPTSVRYGETFFIETPDSSEIAKITWIRLPSVTHSFDQNQRLNFLSFSQTTGGLKVTAPASGNLCPPGHYMLFILNRNGVPSVAKIIRIG